MGMTNAEILDAAALLLVEIAGPAPAHIEMSRTGPKKYYSVARPLTQADARAHLRGVRTKGALCSRPDGRTRALAYDADEAECWEQLQAAARKLTGAGYRPILEPSPAGRGGHLWLVFTALVDASAARSHAHSIAPELSGVVEYWPGPASVTGWNRIRLPGGRYVRPSFSVWCKLYGADGQELAHDGLSAARALLDTQAPAYLIPARPTGDTQHPVTLTAPSGDRDAQPPITPSAPITTASGPEGPAKRNMPRLRNEPAPAANRFLWFRYSAAQLADWFNARHTLEELHPRERGGMAYSPSVSERTPSTGYYETQDGERWTDFSARARRPDGSADGGDALELYVRLQGGSKAAVLRELGREMVAEARRELEATARAGAEPPLWVQEIMTSAGWEHYHKTALAQRQRNQDDEPQRRR